MKRTVSIRRILEDMEAPPVIDYMSLDVEGADAVEARELSPTDFSN